MGLLSKLFGAADEEAAEPKQRSAGGARDGGKVTPDSGKKGPPAKSSLNVDQKRSKASATSTNDGDVFETIADGIGLIGDVYADMTSLVGMVQALAKSASRSDQERKQQFLDLRGHFTSEMDALREAMRDRMVQEAGAEVFRTILPALDDMDHVLREAATREDHRGFESLRLVRRKLRNAFSRLGIEEIRVEEGVTMFDPNIHEGKPYEGDDASKKALPAGSVVEVERMGYMAGEKVLRCTVVTVVKG